MEESIEVPYMEDNELQARFEHGLIINGVDFMKSRSIHDTSMTVIVKDKQEAFWLGCNYVALAYKLFDNGITKRQSFIPKLAF